MGRHVGLGELCPEPVAPLSLSSSWLLSLDSHPFSLRSAFTFPGCCWL